MDDGIPSILLVLVLLLFAALFAVCETAYASVSKVRLKTLSDRGDRRAVKALYISEHFDRAITTILIGTNILHLATASFVTVQVTRRFGIGYVTLSTFITTIVVFFVGEMLPKSIGKKYCELLSLSTASFLTVFMRLFAPISAVLTAIGQGVSRLFPKQPELSVTEDELYDIIDQMTDEGELDEDQGELVTSALSFSDVPVESVLTPRMDMAALRVDMPADEVLAFIRQQRHSRVPVYEGTPDHIIGILPIRRYIRAWLSMSQTAQALGDSPPAQPALRDLVDPALFVHQSMHIDELLRYMSAHKTNLVLVTDNYGGLAGLVTVEDILEELVGEIWDEDDEVVEPIVPQADGSYLVDASVPVEDAFAYMSYEDPEDQEFNHKLLGEWAYEHFDLIPGVGEHFAYHDLTVTVTEVRDRRILKLRLSLDTPELCREEPETP